jgi:hypothetical protein
MGKPSLMWQVILAALNLLVFLGIIQVWWSDSGLPKSGPSQKTEVAQLDLPRRDSQPKTTYQIVAAKNLFSAQRRSTVKTETAPLQNDDFDKNILQGIIVVGPGRMAIVTSKDAQASSKVEIIRPGETWRGYKVLEIGPETVTFQSKDGIKTMIFPEPKAKAGIVRMK